MATNEQMQAAYKALAAQYNNNVPWSVKKAFQDQWYPAVQKTQAAQQLQIANPYAQYANAQPIYGTYVDAYSDLLAAYQKEQSNFASKAAFGQYHWEKYGQAEGRNLNLFAENQAKAQQAQLASQQATIDKQLADQAAQYAALQKEQESKTQLLQEQLKQAQSVAPSSTNVGGVRTAAGADASMKIGGRGMRDAFRRTGMQIQSLNI